MSSVCLKEANIPSPNYDASVWVNRLLIVCFLLIFLFLVLVDQCEVQMVRPPSGLDPEMVPRRSGNPCHWHRVLRGTDALISYPSGEYLTLLSFSCPHLRLQKRHRVEHVQSEQEVPISVHP
jgi:hypothetical protein